MRGDDLQELEADFVSFKLQCRIEEFGRRRGRTYRTIEPHDSA